MDGTIHAAPGLIAEIRRTASSASAEGQHPRVARDRDERRASREEEMGNGGTTDRSHLMATNSTSKMTAEFGPMPLAVPFSP